MRLENQKNSGQPDAYTAEIIRQVEAEGLLKAPKHMKQEILQRSRRPEVQLVVQTREISKGLQFFFYSMKVGAAVVMALFLLFAVPRDFSSLQVKTTEEAVWKQEQSIGEKMNEGMREVNQMLHRFRWTKQNRIMED